MAEYFTATIGLLFYCRSFFSFFFSLLYLFCPHPLFHSSVSSTSSLPPQPPSNLNSNKPDNSKHSSYGSVPSYLQSRKLQWAEEERLRSLAAPDLSCPPGMVCMSEAERLDTLAVLSRSEEEAKRELFALPLTVNTVAMTRRKNGLEAKLKEIEDARKIFSRAKVYITAE